MKNRKTIAFKNAEIRASEQDGKRIVEGLIPYNKKSVQMFGFREIIAPSAFNKTLADKKNVYALFNHDTGKVLGSTAGGTLSLESTGDGLRCICSLPNTSYGDDCWEVISRKDSNTMSFMFTHEKYTDSENGELRTLESVNLLEVSFCVPFPAYPDTTSQARELGELLENMQKRFSENKQLNNEAEKMENENTGNVSIDDIAELVSTYAASIENEPDEAAIEKITAIIEVLQKLTDTGAGEKETEQAESTQTDATQDEEKRACELLVLELEAELCR